jgi:hypothetical protein
VWTQCSYLFFWKSPLAHIACHPQNLLLCWSLPTALTANQGFEICMLLIDS